jgi:K+-sensing histidine kinase KdpD
VPVRELLAEVYLLVVPFAVAAGVSLDVECEHAPDVVRGDRTALLWALMNLACSAVKISPSGGRVSLSALVGTNTVELRVADTRPGVPSLEVDEIFEPLGRQYAADEVKIARDLTRLMGGELFICTTAGVGSLYAMRFHAPRRLARQVTLAAA